MAHFTSLPTEVIVCVWLFLPPADIKACKLVSRPLIALIQRSLDLQYLLELDTQGFVPPLDSSDKLSLYQKVLILREKRSITESGRKHGLDAHMANFKLSRIMHSNIQYSRGVLAVADPPTDGHRQLRLCQLASKNKSTEYSPAKLEDLIVAADDFRFDPDLDLLALLEVVPIQSGAITDTGMNIHLKSLTTGLPHPLATMPALVNTSRPTFRHQISFQIVGRRLALLYPLYSFCKNSSNILIWDWITGELVVSMPVFGPDFAFISEDVFVVPVGQSAEAESNSVGFLEVYTIADIPSGGCPRHVASLHLPATAGERCHTRGYLIATSPSPAPLLIKQYPKFTPSKRIYEIDPKVHHLCLRIKSLDNGNTPTTTLSGLLFIPVSGIHHVLQNEMAVKSQSHISIPWDDWDRGASWVGSSRLKSGSHCVFGHRAAFIRSERKEPGWRVFLFDLRATAQGETMSEWLRGQGEEKSTLGVSWHAGISNTQMGVREPRIAASFIIPGNKRCANKNVPPKLFLDDEHIVTCDSELFALSVTDRQI
ncbi:hypothetical protein B0J17DRAFT_722120 [Rhizoctonia solani]|nr:hypothetical protein B0J17DRAFT_722120 [Rhizoctonia solani]